MTTVSTVRPTLPTVPTGNNKRPLSESSSPSPKKQKRGTNWDLDDDLALLKLIYKWNFDWESIKKEFHLHQHRRPDETMVTLEKYVFVMIDYRINCFRRWFNVASGQSKYNKPFRYNKFTLPRRKITEEEKTQLEAIYNEQRSSAEASFTECFEYIGKIEAKEIMVTSEDKMTADQENEGEK